jgi:hypothetical protein
VREGEGSPAQLGFRRGELRVVDIGDDAELLETNGGDDGDQRTTAISMVAVARWLGWRRCAIARLECVAIVELARRIPAVWSRVRDGFRVRRERGGGVYIEGAGLARGLGFVGVGSDPTAAARGVSEPVSWRGKEYDRRALPVGV